MGLLYPALPIAAVLALFSVFGAHALKMRTEKNYREMWGAASLAVLPASLFWLYVISAEPSMVTRTLLLIPAGAIVGACIFAWAGYALHDTTAKAQTAPPANTAGTPNMSQSVGKGSVVVGDVKANVGDDSVVVGATDNAGNVIFNKETTIGNRARGGPGSVVIGNDAGGGGATKPKE
jgi:hypothetical protein